MTNKDHDYDFSTIDPVNLGKIQKETMENKEAASTAKANLLQLKNLIMPLLVNLSKDPQKDIHWPNRDVKIGEIIKKIEDLTKNVT